MLNTVISFYNNFDLMFKCSEDVVTKGVQIWLLLIAILLMNASSCESPGEYLHKPYIAGN